MKNAILDIFHRRHACHDFIPDRAIPSEDMNVILEAGRLSPSSFGLEQWKFVIVTRADEKAALQAASFNQPQVGSASVVIVILAKIAEMDPGSDYVKKLMAREYPADGGAKALENYRAFHSMTDVKSWSVTQCHVAAANMMTAAAALSVDSCAIGGYLSDRVKETLDIDGDRYEVALLLPLGYCAEEAPEKKRLPLSELVEYR